MIRHTAMRLSWIREEISCEIAESYSYYVKVTVFRREPVYDVKYTLKGHKYTVYEGNYRGAARIRLGQKKNGKTSLLAPTCNAADLEKSGSRDITGTTCSMNLKYAVTRV